MCLASRKEGEAEERRGVMRPNRSSPLPKPPIWKLFLVGRRGGKTLGKGARLSAKEAEQRVSGAVIGGCQRAMQRRPGA